MPVRNNQNSNACISLSHTCIKPYKYMSALVYQIRREHSEKESITKRRILALFDVLLHTTYTYTIMDDALQNSFSKPNMTPAQHIKSGPYGMLNSKLHEYKSKYALWYKTLYKHNFNAESSPS